MACKSGTTSPPTPPPDLPFRAPAAEELALIALDQHHRVTDSSVGLQGLLGYDGDELIGHPITALLDVDSRSALIASLEQLSGSGSLQPLVVPLLARKRDGQLINVAVQMVTLREHDTGVILVQLNNLQPLMESNQERASLEQRYRSIFEDNVAVKLLVDANTAVIVQANSAAADFYGYKQDDMSGLPLRVLYEDHAGEAISLDLEIVKWRSRQRFFAEHRRANGAIRSVEIETGTLTEDGRELVHAIIHDVTQRRKIEEQLRRVAYDDLESGLPNRASFRRAISQNSKRVLAGTRSLAVVSLLLTEFRDIANTLENDTAIRLTKAIAERLKLRFPQILYLARMSDSMLGLCLFFDDRDNLDQMLRGIVKKSRGLYQINGYDLSTGTCIGAAIVDPEERPDTPIRQSHLALDLAVANTKEYVVFTEDQAQRVLASITLANCLRRALENEEFSLVFQPQVDINDPHRIIGAEALLRWRESESGRFIPPDEFIPVAERTGLIVDIGQWVMRTACLQARNWLDAGMRQFRVSVNVSAVQFRRANLVEQVRQALDETGLPAQNLELEITESVMVDCSQQIIATLGELRAQGVSIAMDDFGTGYSSLSYLKQLPLDRLKIDKQFVLNLATSPKDRNLVNTIIAMTRAMNLRSVAEGIENAEALAYLQAQGVEAGQGFYFSRPLAGDRMLEQIRCSVEQPGWSILHAPCRDEVQHGC